MTASRRSACLLLTTVVLSGVVARSSLSGAASVETRTGDQARPAGGRIAGTVHLTAAARPPSAATSYARRSVSPRAKPLPESRNVVVWLADVPSTGRPPAMRASITQQDEQFAPHVVAVTVGSQVDFPNLDDYFHNVFSLSRLATFDLGRYPTGRARSRTFDRPGIVKVYCHIHAQMSAVVRVFDHPWFTIPDESGAFAIDGVPVGDYTLVAWHDRIGERRQQLTIRAGATTSVTLTLPVLEPPS